MLASSARVVPANLVSALPSAQVRLPSALLISTPGIACIFRVPFGPLTVIPSAATWHSTPLGSAMGFLATRDMFSAPCCLRDARDHFAAETLGARLRVGHQAGRSGHDGDAEPAQHLGQSVLAAIHAKTGAADALDALDRRLALKILQLDFKLRLAAVF